MNRGFLKGLQLALLTLLLSTASGWQVVEDLAHAPGVVVHTVGPPQQPFARPPPRSVEASLLQDFEPAFNLMQDLQPSGSNLFTQTAEQYVAAIPRAYVEGESGVVYDSSRRVFQPPHLHFNRTSSILPLPQHTVVEAESMCERHELLASVIQRYGHMYYHFLAETLPRVVLLQEANLTAQAKLLTWGQPYEYEWLKLLGIPASSTVPYDPACVYCAATLLLPTPTPRITSPREALLAVRRALGVATLPEEERQLVVYVSREGEPTRRVSNEQQLLGAIQASFPGREVVVFRGGLTPSETISLFQRARVVVGPHGAGLTHSLFSAPGTALVEFGFLADPPMMFWHSAAALGQDYWLVPVPQAHWMQESMEVPIDEVLDVLAAILPQPAAATQPPDAAPLPTTPAPLPCPPGSFFLSGKCWVCPAGTYSFNPASWTCKPCFHGRVAASDGSAFCTTCQPGTYSSPDRRQCVPCPGRTFNQLPGAWEQQQCLAPEQRRQQMEDVAANVAQLAKLSPLFARSTHGRALIEAVSGGDAVLRQDDLCAALAQAGPFSDPYRGPYLLSTPSLDCKPVTGVLPSPYPQMSPAPEFMGWDNSSSTWLGNNSTEQANSTIPPQVLILPNTTYPEEWPTLPPLESPALPPLESPALPPIESPPLPPVYVPALPPAGDRGLPPVYVPTLPPGPASPSLPAPQPSSPPSSPSTTPPTSSLPSSPTAVRPTSSPPSSPSPKTPTKSPSPSPSSPSKQQPLGKPQPPAPQQPEQGSKGGVATWVIIVASVGGGLALILAAVLTVRYARLRRSSSPKHESLAVRITAAGGGGHGFENLAFERNPTAGVGLRATPQVGAGKH